MGDRVDQFYTVLGVSSSASFQEIKAAYRRRVKQWHPDQFCNDEQQQQHANAVIQQLNEAYEYFKSRAQAAPSHSPNHPSSCGSVTIHRTRPMTAREHYQRGVECAKAGQYTDAIDAFSMAIRLDADYADAYQYRGLIYSVLGYEHRASSDLSKAKRLQMPTQPGTQADPSPSTSSCPPQPNPIPPRWACVQVLLGHRDVVSAVAFSRDRRIVFSGSWDGQIRLWNLKTGETFGTLEHGEAVYAIALSPEGDHLASAGKDSKIRLWHWKTGSLVRTLSGHASTVRSLAFTLNRRQLISASFDHTLKLWDIQQNQAVHTFIGHTAPVWALSMNPDGQTVISGGEDQQICLWHLHTRRLIQSYPCSARYIYAIASHPNRQNVLVGTSDRTVLALNLHTQAIAPFPQYLAAIRTVAIDPVGHWRASGGDDAQVQVVTPEGDREILKGHTDTVMSIAFNLDGKTMASASTDRTIRLWRKAACKE